MSNTIRHRSWVAREAKTMSGAGVHRSSKRDLEEDGGDDNSSRTLIAQYEEEIEALAIDDYWDAMDEAYAAKLRPCTSCNHYYHPDVMQDGTCQDCIGKKDKAATVSSN